MALNDDKMTAMVNFLKTTGAMNDLERKFWATFTGTGNGNGVISIPSNYIFKGANRQAAEAVRNALPKSSKGWRTSRSTPR